MRMRSSSTPVVAGLHRGSGYVRRLASMPPRLDRGRPTGSRNVATCRASASAAGSARARSRRSRSTRFLSDCETCALVAPSGNVEWLCLPRFDSPSVFGAILDRDAGMFRLGPDGVKVPAARRYLPGTMVLETSWDARRLDHRPRRPAHRAVASRGRALAHAPPRAHRLRRRARAPTPRAVRERRGPVQPRLRAVVRLRPSRRRAGSTTAPATTRRWRARTASTTQLRLTTGMRLGFEGPRARRGR